MPKESFNPPVFAKFRVSPLRPKSFPYAHSDRVQPIVNVFAHLIFGVAVASLNLAFQLIAPAIDGSQIVIGQLAPLLFDAAGKLLPIA
jgi:hypothetical protein